MSTDLYGAIRGSKSRGLRCFTPRQSQSSGSGAHLPLNTIPIIHAGSLKKGQKDARHSKLQTANLRFRFSPAAIFASRGPGSLAGDCRQHAAQEAAGAALSEGFGFSRFGVNLSGHWEEFSREVRVPVLGSLFSVAGCAGLRFFSRVGGGVVGGVWGCGGGGGAGGVEGGLIAPFLLFQLAPCACAIFRSSYCP